jgi:DUF971 family protein
VCALAGELLPRDAVPAASLLSSIRGGGVHPTSFECKGNYGVGIVWSDGHHADIHTFEVLKAMALRQDR